MAIPEDREEIISWKCTENGKTNREADVPGLVQLHSRSPTEAVSAVLKVLSKDWKWAFQICQSLKAFKKKTKDGLNDEKGVLDHLSTPTS